MFLLYFLLLIGAVSGSHYRGGTMSYGIRAISDNITTNGQEILVRITQRHSWRRSVFFCNDTDPNTGNIIGEVTLQMIPTSGSYPSVIPSINTSVRCTDYNEEFDYSSGESSINVLLPLNKKIEYLYQGCCWIPLLPPDLASGGWVLKFIINTNRRIDGTLNNSPKTTMNPIVQVQFGKIHVIRIPMADSDGDPIQCRWGNSTEECGSICAPKGFLRSNPCELTYNASQIGYQAVALVIEDFDSNNNVLSAIPLQFLIEIVNTTTTNDSTCPDPPVYIGEWPQDSCIGVESNTTINARIQIRIPCQDTSITLDNILTVSPAGFIRGEIARDPSDQNLYTMPTEWTPDSNQYGIHQLCVTPVDSQQRSGSQVCLTFQVDISPPEFILLTPTGLVTDTQSLWTIETDRDIVKSRRSSGVHIRFYKRSSNEEIYRIDVTNDVNVFYQPRQIMFFTTGYTWEQGEEYYILLDSGIAIINESCGVESVQINNPYAWVFRVATAETTFTEESITTQSNISQTTEQSSSTNQITSTSTVPQTTEQSRSTSQITSPSIVPQTTEQSSSTRQITSTSIVPQTTEQSSSTRQMTSPPQSHCPQWFQFGRISNESTSANEPYFTFCFTVETEIADVTISANTWVSCMMWKLSGTADPLLELYTEPDGKLLAENDDGNSMTLHNCYAAILSYRLGKGDYRVIIRNPKCAYGKFELRLSAEIGRNLK